MSIAGIQAGRYYNSMFSIAGSGIRDATLRMANAAHNIANANTDRFLPDRVNSMANPNGSVYSIIEGWPATEIPQTEETFHSQTDLITEGLHLLLAKNAFNANAAVIRTGNETHKTLIDAFG